MKHGLRETQSENLHPSNAWHIPLGQVLSTDEVIGYLANIEEQSEVTEAYFVQSDKQKEGLSLVVIRDSPFPSLL